MRQSVFCHPVMKVICPVLCILSLLICVYTGGRLIWMDRAGVFGGEEGYSPYSLVSDNYLPVSDDFVWPYITYWYENDGFLYGDSFSAELKTILSGLPAEDTWEIVSRDGVVYPAAVQDAAEPLLQRFTEKTSNFVFRITDGKGRVFLSNMADDTAWAQVSYRREYPFRLPAEMQETPDPQETRETEDFCLSFGVRGGLPVEDAYRTFFLRCEEDYGRMGMWFLCFAGSVLLAAGSLLLTVLGAGLRCRDSEVHRMPFDRLPLELAVLIKGLLLGGGTALLFEMGDWLYRWSTATAVLYGYLPGNMLLPTERIMLIGMACCLLFVLLVCLWILCGAARRIRSRTFFSNTAAARLGRLILRALRHAARSGIIRAVENLPVLWKWLLAWGSVMLLGLILILFGFRAAILFPVWVVFSTVLCALACRFLIGTERVRQATETIASGRLDVKIDVASLDGVPRQMGVNLNHIGDAMSVAVDERMKSERFRTELITNVSHDIKTPLTSIINYTDLLSREQPENERMRDYIDVLSRQSERLKKLIEDLLEASKASSGTVSVSLAEMDAGEPLEQAAGEYGERFGRAELTPIVKVPEVPVLIRADGRHLWRVFDNLLSNICKYSMPGTRVYLQAERSDGRAVLTFRNISSQELNVSADELTERFVRGDLSRHTEGSGLGLAIAKSLTELQGGELSLTADGDLFKVTVRFPLAEIGKV